MRTAALKKPVRAMRGYSLLETAMVLTVAGIFMASFFPVYRLYIQRMIQETTINNASLASSALSNFLVQRGRYPCPARIDARRDEADYGVETDCTFNPMYNKGTDLGGVWLEESEAIVDMNPNPLTYDPGKPMVRRGMLPFRTLALPEDMAFDGYNNRFVYVVTEPQATDNYQKGNGGVEIRNAQNDPYFAVEEGSDGIFLRPDGTITATNVSPASPHLQISGPTELGADSFYARTATGVTSNFIVSLSDPLGIIDTASGNATVSIRLAKLNGGGNPTGGGSDITNVVVRVLNGGTVVHTANLPNVTSGSWMTRTFDFPTSSIPLDDWDDVRVRITHSPVSNRSLGISWLQLEAPRISGTYVDYFLFSPGQDQAGARSRWGEEVNPCPAVGLDAQNCDLTPEAIYVMADRVDAQGAAHFDDFARFYQSTEVPLWRVSGAGAHIRDLLGVEAINGKVAIAQTPNMAPAMPVLQVGGEVRAAASAAMLNQICDDDEANCWIPEKLGTADADFQCPAGEYAVGFEYGAIKCSPPDEQNNPCAAGQLMTGIAPDGTPECTNTRSCPPLGNVRMCRNSSGQWQYATIPAGIDKQSYTTPTFGYNRTKTFTCGVDQNGDPSDPIWHEISQNGICDCTVVDEDVDVPCNNTRAGNWTGFVTYHHTHTCPDDQDNSVPVSNNCVCAPTTETQIDPCPSGFSGNITRQRTWSCSSDTAGSWSAWTTTSNTCTCQPRAPETRNRNCGANTSGTWRQQRDYECPAGTWGAWYDIQNTCACSASTEDRNAGCPSGYTGSRRERRTYNCSTNSWGPWTVYEDTCGCTPVSNQTQNLNCQTGYTGEIRQSRDFVCPSATWTAWTTTSNTCTCDSSIYTDRTVSCAAPLSGTKKQRRFFNCSTNAWGAWADIEDNCYIVTYTWRPKTAASGPYTTQLPVRAGDTCSPAGSTSPCCAQAGGGSGWLHYAECACE